MVMERSQILIPQGFDSPHLNLHCGNQFEAKEKEMEEITNLQGRGSPWEALKNLEEGDEDIRPEEGNQVTL